MSDISMFRYHSQNWVPQQLDGIGHILKYVVQQGQKFDSLRYR